ncbi:DUF2125 domain-containing protein [Paracoccus sp. (in: a-proteobacteria)]|uniref:DUF2125 domain-containing protein n=1 Tax=Paracoccus sp. TaxID=267 RepID=UPI0035AD78A5
MFRFAATSALALTVGAAPVLADVTPAQVWENLETYFTDFGYEVTGTVEDAGSTLTVTDAVLSMDNEGGATTVTIPKMTFQETGDAKVRAVIDGDMALESKFKVPAPAEPEADATAEGTDTPAEPAPAEPEMVDMTMTGTIKAPGNEMVVSGTPEDMLYEYDYPSVEFDFAMPAGPESGATIPVSGALTNVTGSQRNATGEASEYSFDMKASEGTMGIVADVPADPETAEGGGKVDVQAKLTDLSLAGTARTPGQSFDLATQMAEALAAGLNFQGTFAYAAMDTRFDFAGKDEAGQDQTGSGSVATGAADVALQMSEQGLGYKGSVADTKVEMTTGSLPFPVSYAAVNSSFDLLIPVSKADAAQPFKFAYALEGLTFADGIWNLFDPNSQLPRDPASLSIDLSGDAVVAQDLFDPALAQPDPAAAPEVPFTPRSLTVNKVALDAVGATADITGQLEFGDNPNEPVGKLNGTFAGVNGLMDKLVAMGLVPEEQMMGMRMMLAMFAKPAEGNPDKLTSEIEFREGGSIFANGQQVK